jgi:hypothetical protein
MRNVLVKSKKTCYGAVVDVFAYVAIMYNITVYNTFDSKQIIKMSCNLRYENILLFVVCFLLCYSPASVF